MISLPALADEHGLLWVLMITSAAHRAWAHDVPIADLGAAGLARPSVVRVAKIATVAAQRCAGIGQLARQPAEMVTARLQAILVPVAAQARPPVNPAFGILGLSCGWWTSGRAQPEARAQRGRTVSPREGQEPD